MTIRHTLLMSYLFISLASALLITLLIFVHLRDILSAEIEEKLQSQAIVMMQQIDTTLFDRMENMAMWSQLEVMQEVRVRDVDKRLARFLNELQTGSDGVYQRIFVTNLQGDIIAASDAALIGKYYPRTQPWLHVVDNNHTHTLAPLDSQHNTPSFSIAIPDAVQQGELGYLYADFNWNEIAKLLTKHLSTGAYALLVDGDNRIMATSTELTNKNLLLQPFTESLHLVDKSLGLFFGEVVLVGRAASEGYSTFKGFGWQVLIVQPSKIAFAPMWRLWQVILVFLCLTLLLGIVIAFWMSAKIARPIVQLADFTRDFMRGTHTEPPLHNESSIEVTELITQFSLMIDTLEQSKLDIVRVAKLAVIGEMAASMAHEVRTPLGILRSSAQILQREPQLTAIGLEMTEFILSETKRLNALVTTLLECARPRASEFVRQDVYAIMRHAVELLQTQLDNKDVQISLQLSRATAQLYCDHDQMLQVFLNLIMNALQHINDSGQIVLSSHVDKQQLEVCIADDGAGIADADKVHVFEPFYTQRQDGIGLGLTVVQQIILAHHGKIFVTDSAIGGACFHIVLPIGKPA
jgi:signal transduction histidine kinase